MKIINVPHNSLRLFDWRSNYVLKPDMDLLRLSMREFGWMQPVIVRAEDSRIIDGAHRWIVAGEDKFAKKFGSDVPCIFVDCDEIDAMIMHVRMNRSRGSMFARPFSKLLKKIVLSNKYAPEELEDILVMSVDEVDLMLTGGLLKQRKIPEHTYSRAWVPVEAPDKKQVESFTIERPPNPDR